MKNIYIYTSTAVPYNYTALDLKAWSHKLSIPFLVLMHLNLHPTTFWWLQSCMLPNQEQVDIHDSACHHQPVFFQSPLQQARPTAFPHQSCKLMHPVSTEAETNTCMLTNTIMNGSKVCDLLTYSMAQSPSWEANCLQLIKKFPAFYGTRRFITALTSVRHLSLSWANPIQST